jgi:hypothetical protein
LSLPPLYAHRLGRHYGPDSSAAALRHTLTGPVEGLETDVCLTADDRLVLPSRVVPSAEYVGMILLVSLLMVGMVVAIKGFNNKLAARWATGIASIHKGENPRHAERPTGLRMPLVVRSGSRSAFRVLPARSRLSVVGRGAGLIRSREGVSRVRIASIGPSSGAVSCYWSRRGRGRPRSRAVDPSNRRENR